MGRGDVKRRVRPDQKLIQLATVLELALKGRREQGKPLGGELQWSEFSMKSWLIPAWQHSSRELSCSLPQHSSAKRMQTA